MSPRVHWQMSFTYSILTITTHQKVPPSNRSPPSTLCANLAWGCVLAVRSIFWKSRLDVYYTLLNKFQGYDFIFWNLSCSFHWLTEDQTWHINQFGIDFVAIIVSFTTSYQVAKTFYPQLHFLSLYVFDELKGLIYLDLLFMNSHAIFVWDWNIFPAINDNWGILVGNYQPASSFTPRMSHDIGQYNR